MYVYKKPVEQELWGVSNSQSSSHRGAGAVLRLLGVRYLELDPCASLQWVWCFLRRAVGARACERERDSHVSAFSWGRLRFALRLPGTDSSAAPNGRCGPEPLASKGEMMARLSTGIKVPQQTLPAIKSRKGDAHASPERENSNLRVKLHWKLEQKCRRAKESSGADFVYMHSTLYLNYTLL